MTKVEVYRNLHGDNWSIRQAHGKVLWHSSDFDLSGGAYIYISNVEWVVQPGGRQRVLREKSKSVHAFARGVIEGKPQVFAMLPNDAKQVTYDPYKYESFVIRATEKPIYLSTGAFFGSKPYEVYASGIVTDVTSYLLTGS